MQQLNNCSGNHCIGLASAPGRPSPRAKGSQLLCSSLGGQILRVLLCSVCITMGCAEANRVDVCQLAPGISDSALELIRNQNCDKVSRALQDFIQFAEAGKTGGMLQQTSWMEKIGNATSLCGRAAELATSGFMHAAASLAANAWGSLIMEGAECCTLPGPPFCEATSTDWHSVVSLVLLGAILIGLLLISFIFNFDCWATQVNPNTLQEEEQSTAAPTLSAFEPHSAPSSARKNAAKLQAQLDEVWMRGSCLRVLPGAAGFARSSGSLFASLQDAFRFQEDNARNQYEHLLSLWRSHCSLVADRYIADELSVNEQDILAKALDDLHVDLLDGFRCWRTKFCSHAATGIPCQEEVCLPRAGQVNWEFIQLEKGVDDNTSQTLSAQLAEVAMYLLVWGEAGNLRFMPEVVYFITEMALASDHIHYHGCAQNSELYTHSTNQFSGLFLAKIVRPLYNVLFNEWYDSVDIDATGKDKKQLHQGLEAFLPADIANYDDWNELFCDPKRLCKRLVLNDGSPFFSLPHGHRFSAIQRIDWAKSLKSSETKTHREVHSFWGIFAATHRIWLLHMVLFLGDVCLVAKDPSFDMQEDGIGWNWPIDQARFASIGLVVPVHALLWFFARWQVTGRAFRWRRYCTLGNIFGSVFIMLPLASYLLVWMFYQNPQNILSTFYQDQQPPAIHLSIALGVHYAVSLRALVSLLLIPSSNEGEKMWSMTGVSLRQRIGRYLFWLMVLTVKFCSGLLAVSSMYGAIVDLNFTRRGYETPRDLGSILTIFTVKPHKIFQWLQLWGVSFMFYVTDTQLWFTLCATFLGMFIAFSQRRYQLAKFLFEDAVAKIPERFSKKVLFYTTKSEELKTAMSGKPLSQGFPALWDRIVEYMRYEDDIDHETMGSLCFASRRADNLVTFDNLSRPLGSLRKIDRDPKLCKSGCGRNVQEGFDLSGKPYTTCCRSCAKRPCNSYDKQFHDKECCAPAQPKHTGVPEVIAETTGTPPDQAEMLRAKLHIPGIFHVRQASEIFWQTYCCVPNQSWPTNADVQWRITAMARSLGHSMPRPFRAPYIPGMTVLIPHYAESIVMQKADLYKEIDDNMKADGTLIDFLKYRWDDEFRAFSSRQHARSNDWPAESGGQWEDYSTAGQWGKLGGWCSMRMQTLWRTVAGMCLYHPALQCHYELQADSIKHPSRLSHPSIWDPSDCFTCLVSMQMYKYFNKQQLSDTNRMFMKFPDCLKVAFIDNETKGTNAHHDCVHPQQKRRYFSCLIDKSCEEEPDGSKKPKFRIELPGYPILGDGKGDNQNHAIPFMRGTFAQCIDANQGAYFEQMLLLPCVLGEFRTHKRGDGNGKKIVGFPEHITSDIGSVGDMAASAEFAFGTILQRTYAVLGARMHYGHPDVMNKYYMMQQGGVSKATKSLNLSEDIFAGMDFTLRGEGRSIKHCEYFHLAKGRDLGFNTVLGFFSKLASGAGEQILTRQMFRLGQLFHLPEALTFYYAHVGYYLNQFFVSWSLPVLLQAWLLVLLADCEGSFQDFQDCNNGQSSELLAKAFSIWFSTLLFLFLIAASMPLLAQLWLEQNLKTAIVRLLKQWFTLSPLLFIFQAKVIGSYLVNEIRLGGAQYVNTGRALPIERRPFLGTIEPKRFSLKKVEGLYLDYASVAYYDGATLLVGAVLVRLAGGIHGPTEGSSGQLIWLWISLGLVITSWTFAPFIYNPHQFRILQFKDDLRAWCAFFAEEGGKHWSQWYEKSQLKLGRTRRVPVDIGLFMLAFFVLSWFEVFGGKVRALAIIYSESTRMSTLGMFIFLPPLAGSFTLCTLVLLVERCLACCSFLCRWLCYRQGVKADERVPPELADQPAPPQFHVRRCPLVIVAILVVLLDVLETVTALYDFLWIDWKGALIAGSVFKYATVSAFLYLAEEVLRSPCFQQLRDLGKPLELLVYAHRMARDLMTSALILVALSPFVLLNNLNLRCCPGFSVHHLLIYRDPGRPARQNLMFTPIQQKSRKFGKSFWKSDFETSRIIVSDVFSSEKSAETELMSEKTQKTDVVSEMPDQVSEEIPEGCPAEETAEMAGGTGPSKETPLSNSPLVMRRGLTWAAFKTEGAGEKSPGNRLMEAAHSESSLSVIGV